MPENLLLPGDNVIVAYSSQDVPDLAYVQRGYVTIRRDMELQARIEHPDAESRCAQGRNRTVDTRIFNPDASRRKRWESERKGEAAAGGVADV